MSVIIGRNVERDPCISSENAGPRELLNAYERGLGEHYGVTREQF